MEGYSTDEATPTKINCVHGVVINNIISTINHTLPSTIIIRAVISTLTCTYEYGQ